MSVTKRQIILILAVWAGIVGGMIALGGTPVTTGKFLDSDDYMRMVRVTGILDGNGVPSHFEPRLGPKGAEMGWSRLVDWPLVAMQGVLELFMPRLNAAMWTATIMPALMLLVLLLVSCFYMRPVLGSPVTFFMLLAVFAQWAILRQFVPGRVDHHMWQIVLCILGYAGIVRLYISPETIRTAIFTGMAFGFGLAVGADIVPWLAAAGALLAWFWLLSGRQYERPILFFGLGVGITTLGLYLLLTPFDRLTYVACDALSPFWVSMALAVTAFGGIIFFLPEKLKNSRAKRLITGGITAALVSTVLFRLFGDCILDPYMIEDPIVRDMWLYNVGEAKSIIRLWEQDTGIAKLFITPCILGLFAVLAACYKDKQNRSLWSGLCIVLGLGAALSFYQVRTMDFTQAIAILPLAWLFVNTAKSVANAAATLSYKKRLTISSVFFVTALIAFIFASMHRQEINLEKSEQNEYCRKSYVAEILNKQPAPQMIAAHIDFGGYILLFTDHKVLSAPYHRNEEGLRAGYDIFIADTPADAMKSIAKYNVDILVYCEDPDNLWKLTTDRDDVFIDQLLAGNIPNWLSPLGVPEEGYKIYKVEYRP